MTKGVPTLAPYEGSWMVTHLVTGEVREFFRDRHARVAYLAKLPKEYRIETSSAYLSRTGGRHTQRCKYFVKGEHSLLYHIEGSHLVGVLAGKPQLGGFDRLYGPVCITWCDTRPATQEDFAEYRVQLPPDFEQGQNM